MEYIWFGKEKRDSKFSIKKCLLFYLLSFYTHLPVPHAFDAQYCIFEYECIVDH